MGNSNSNVNNTSSSSSSSSSDKARSVSRSSLSDGNGEEKSSYFEMVKEGYQQLVNAIIRPPRCIYTIKQLGPNLFDFCGKTFYRKDFQLLNPRGLKLQCSMWEPMATCRNNPIIPCVVYMHGNSSARLEALAQLSIVLSLGISYCAFDFAGSGLSEGDYVSLGAYEKDDLKVVIEYLRSLGTVSTIALWGRSMGAATALLHGERDPSIAGMVLDSAFSDLNVLAEEMVDKGRQQGLFAPSLIVKMAISFIRSSVQKKANFDIKDLSPIAHADKCYIPALFVAAENDAFVAPHHSKNIYDKYAGDKNLIMVEGDHNSPRPRFFFDSVSIFLAHTMQIPDDWILPDSNKFIHMFPWMTGRKARYVDLESENIGMTKARQEEIQTKLFRMMGSSNGGGNSRSNDTNKNTSSINSPKPGEMSSNSSLLTDSENVSINIIKNDDVPSNSIFNFDASQTQANTHLHQLQHETEENWACSTCTLINAWEIDCCDVCGIPRYNDF